MLNYALRFRSIPEQSCPMADKLPIPKQLQVKEWNSHKGVIAKLVKSTRKTGVSEALKDFYDYYNFKGAWGYWGDSEIAGNVRMGQDPKMGDVGPRQLQLGLDAIPEFLTGCKAKLLAVKTAATKAAAEFKKSKIIPSSSRVYLENMAKVSESFYNDVKKSLDDSIKKIKAAQKLLGKG